MDADLKEVVTVDVKLGCVTGFVMGEVSPVFSPVL